VKGFIEWNLRTLTGTKNITPKARIIMSILQQKLKLPTDLVKIKKGDKVLFLNPNAPDWIVVSPNGAAILQLCNGRRTVENIAESLQKFWRKDSKAKIINFIKNIISDTTFFSPPSTLPVYQPSGLRIVQLSLVNECNLECIYCYATDREKSTKRLSREDHFKLVDDINAISKDSVIVFTGGEPLLSPYVIELAEYAKSLGNQVHILTNGTLINKENAKQISETFNLIKISLDGSTSEIHELHRGKGSFTKTLQAIDLLIQQEAPIQIAMTVTQKNIHDIDAMTKKFGSRLTFAPLFVAGRAKSSKGLSITGTEYYQALSSVNGVKPLSYLCTSLAASKQKRIMKCAIGDGEISISETGNVYPCQLLHFPQFCAGNIREQSLKSIYETSAALQACKELTVLKVAGCKKCDIRFICGGACRARAFYEENRLDVSGNFCEYEKLAFINGLFELHEF
jgi:radical SAM protein with 4Fe4S-binding SPASM domain